MAEVNIYQYAVISRSGAQSEIIGSKVTPTTISLTGTGEVIHRVYNDIGTTSSTTLYSSTLTGLKWFAIKPSVEIVVSFGNDDTADHTSSIVVAANVWQFFNSGKTTEGVDGSALSVAGRAIQVQANIDTITAYNALAADIEFIAAY